MIIGRENELKKLRDMANTEKDINSKVDNFIMATGTKYAIFPTLVTTYGLADGMYAGIFQSVVTLKDLF